MFQSSSGSSKMVRQGKKREQSQYRRHSVSAENGAGRITKALRGNKEAVVVVVGWNDGKRESPIDEVSKSKLECV